MKLDHCEILLRIMIRMEKRSKGAGGKGKKEGGGKKERQGGRRGGEERHVSHGFSGWGEPRGEAVGADDNVAWLESLDNRNTTAAAGIVCSFRVVSWNILAPDYCYRHFYKHLSDAQVGRVLDWRSRQPQILRHLLQVAADVICLQEVQEFAALQGMLAAKGYEGVFKQRTGHKMDGLAIFWLTSKFELLGRHETLQFDDTMGKDGEHRVALRVCLASLEQVGRRLNVATTHWDYKRPRAQVEMARQFAVFCQDALREARDGLIACGDFNCEWAHDAVQEFFSTFNGKLQPSLPLVTPARHSISTACIKEPKAIDHMFYMEPALELVGIKCPSLSWAKIPHETYPSDHEMIGGMFVWKDKD